MSWSSLFWILGAYALGSLSFSLIVARMVSGIDLRTRGSGNLGATNTGRVLGRRLGFLVFLLDFLKGLLPVLLARYPLGDPLLFEGTISLAALLGTAAVLGHYFPLWHGLRGGKGVATSSGMLVGLTPLVATAGLLVFTLGFLWSRVVAVGSCLAALSLPLALLCIKGPGLFHTAPLPGLFALYLGLALLVVARHKQNLARLLKARSLK